MRLAARSTSVNVIDRSPEAHLAVRGPNRAAPRRTSSTASTSTSCFATCGATYVRRRQGVSVGPGFSRTARRRPW